jgi:hypothetical protein
MVYVLQWKLPSLKQLSHRKKEIKMLLIINSAMLLIGILALLLFDYLDEKS